MTTALVLAAGLGTRLRSVTSQRKWSVPVADTTPMREQLAAIESSASIERVVVIVSGDTAGLSQQLAEIPLTKPIDLVDNPDADKLNNWSSALIGLDAVEDDAVVLLNSDLFAHHRWLSTAIADAVACPTPGLVIDTERELTDEAMKVAGTGSLTSIGKVGVDDPVGEYVGIAWWPAGTSGPLREALAAFRGRADAEQNWYEHGIGDDMAAGTVYAPVPTPSVEWVEIDDEADHRQALALWDTNA